MSSANLSAKTGVGLQVTFGNACADLAHWPGNYWSELASGASLARRRTASQKGQSAGSISLLRPKVNEMKVAGGGEHEGRGDNAGLACQLQSTGVVFRGMRLTSLTLQREI